MILYKARRSLSLICAAVLIIAGVFVYSYMEKKVTVKYDGKTKEVRTFSNSVENVLKELKITLADEDLVTPAKEAKLREGMKIEVKRAFPVTIICDGKENSMRVQPDKVENLLAKADIVLDEMDRVEPKLDQYIDKPTDIIVIRVCQEVTEEIRQIQYEIVSRKDSSMPTGQKKVVQKGEKGQEKIITTNIIENGKVIASTSKSKILKPAKPEIVLIGSMTVASRGGQEFSYANKLRMLATAYTHTGNLTAMGTKPRAGVAAVDPKVIPLGSRLYIDGYGYARAEDTGGAIKGEKIDLFMETESKVNRFGRRWVTVFILK